VNCSTHGPTVAEVPWARHDSAFTPAFEDLVVHDAIVGNKQAAADRCGISWRARSTIGPNGIAESNSAAIDRIRTNARGFHDRDAFIAMISTVMASMIPASRASEMLQLSVRRAEASEAAAAVDAR
jgi:transposase